MLHPNTIQVVLNIFRTLVKRAIEVEGLMKPDKNPFLTFKYKGVKTIKDKLDIEEIKKIESLELTEGSLIWNCRNYFLFSFYCAGIRVGDLIQLRWENITPDSRICYEMGKNHKARDLKLVSQARSILMHYYKEDAKPSDYIFPMLDSNAMWNRSNSSRYKQFPNLPKLPNPFCLVTAPETDVGMCKWLIDSELIRILQKPGTHAAQICAGFVVQNLT